MKRLYLGLPYSHKDPSVMQARYERSLIIQAQLKRKGYQVYNPISHWHACAKLCDLPTDQEYWWSENKLWLNWADEMAWWRVWGWQESSGLWREITYAHNRQIPVWPVEL